MLQNNFFDLGKLLRNDALAALKARGKFGSPDAENEMRNPNRVTNGRPPPINNYGFSTDPASVPERDQTLATSKPELAKLIEHNKKYDQELYNRRKNFADEWTFCPEVKNVKVQGYSLKHQNEFQHSKLRISTGPWTKPFQLELENLKLFGGQLFRLISGIEEIMRANINRETNTLELTLIYPPKLWIPQDVDKEEEQMTVANLLEDCSQFEVFPWSMTIPLQYDIMNRGLANRLDLLAKLSQRIGEKLMVDGVVYKHNPQDMVPDNFRQPIALSSKRQEQPMMVPVRPIGQQPGPNNQPPETSASNEQRIFESNFAKNELQDFKVFEAGTLAKMRQEDKKKLLESKDEVVKFSKLKNPTLRCPVYGCPLFLKPNFNSKAEMLQSHIQRSHKEILDAGIEISETGKIKIPPLLVDKALAMCMYQKKFVQGPHLKLIAEQNFRALEQRAPSQNGHSNGQGGSNGLNGMGYQQN